MGQVKQEKCLKCKINNLQECTHTCAGCTEPDCRDCNLTCGDDCSGCKTCQVGFPAPMSSSESYRRTMKLLGRRNVNAEDIYDEEDETTNIYFPENQS